MQSSHDVEDSPRPPWWQVALIGRNPAHTILRLLLTVGFILFLYQVSIRHIVVQRISMEPTYKEGQKLWVNLLAYRLGDPQRGDIVAVKTTGENVLLLKRIIALPGERFSILAGHVFVDGDELDEPYVKRPKAPWIYPEIRLEANEYLVIGDNREMPMKDHEFGRAKRERILGRIMK